MNNGSQYIAGSLGELLANSFLNKDLKKAILANTDKIPPSLIFGLMEAIERERDELGRIAMDIEIFLQQQNKDWRNLEKEQKMIASKVIEKEIVRIEEDVKLYQVRQKIQQ